MGKFTELLKRTERATPAPDGGQPPQVSSEADPGSGEERAVTQDLSPFSERTCETTRGEVIRQGPLSPKLVVFHDPESLAAEHFKALRAQILYPRDGGERKVILITSAMEQEGKTLVACNLAVSIAQGVDPYCLLIDADLRRPSVHEMLGLEPRHGLSEYLQDGGSVAPYLFKSSLAKLTVLPAGRPPRNPAELMTSEKMFHLIQEVRMRYEDRHVIIDSPPINLAVETITLAQQADAVIMVVRYGISNRDLVEEAMEKIGREKVLGIVFNGFDVPPRRYSYYGKPYRYSSKRTP